MEIVFFQRIVRNNFTTMIRYVLVLIILHGIAFENVCNGRFNWAKYGSETMKEAVEDLMLDLIRQKVFLSRNSRAQEIPNSKNQVALCTIFQYYTFDIRSNRVKSYFYFLAQN